MGLASEIATEATVKEFVQRACKLLKEYEGNGAACRAIREMGRFALTQFEWQTPAWAKPYEKLFEEPR